MPLRARPPTRRAAPSMLATPAGRTPPTRCLLPSSLSQKPLACRPTRQPPQIVEQRSQLSAPDHWTSREAFGSFPILRLPLHGLADVATLVALPAIFAGRQSANQVNQLLAPHPPASGES